MFTRFQWVMTNYMQHVHRLENLTMCTMWVPFSEIIYFHCGQHGFILSQVHCCDISTTSECAIQYIFLYDLLLFSTIHIQIFCDHYAFVVWCQIAYEICFYSSTDHGGRKWFLACLACPFVQSLPCSRPSCSSPCLQFGICIWIFILFHASAGVLTTYNQDVMGVFLLNSHIMIWWSCVPPLSPPGYKEKPSIGVGETMRKFGRGVAEIPVMYLWDPNMESLHCKGRDKIYLTVPFGSLRPTT